MQRYTSTSLACAAIKACDISVSRRGLPNPAQSFFYSRSTHSFSLPVSRISFSTWRTFASQPSLAQLVKGLRQSTGAPLMECKRALQAEEVGMDLDKASQYLRTHGSAKINSKLQGREATEGMVGLVLSPDRRKAALVKVASETDFASRSKDFAVLTEKVAKAAINVNAAGTYPMKEEREQTGGNVAGIDVNSVLLTLPIPDSTTVVKQALDESVLSIRENLQLQSAMLLTTTEATNEKSFLEGYVHKRSPHSVSAGRAAAVVEIVRDASDTAAEVEAVGKKLAMHVVAARPRYLSRNHIPEDALRREKEILMEQVAATGKKQPAEIVEKIINGRLNKFYEQNCLLDQQHMVEEEKVSKVLQDAKLGVKSFRILSI